VTTPQTSRQAASPPKRPRVLAIRPLVGIALLVAAIGIGVLVGLYASSTFVDDATVEYQSTRDELAALQAAHTKLEERNWMLYGRVQALEAMLPTPTVPAGEPVEDSTMRSYADGVYLVGEDIAPGTYAGTVVGESGYWARLNATTGMISAIIASDTPIADFTLTINPSDAAIELRGVVLIGPQ